MTHRPAGAADALTRLAPSARHARLLAAHQRLAPSAAAGAGAAAGSGAGEVVTDADALRCGHRFLRAPEDEDGSWEARLAARYFARLFKEFARADLSRAAAGGGVGLRWRTQAEVLAGAGHLTCGALRCDFKAPADAAGGADGLATFELPFAYEEAGKSREALVKLRLCPAHARDLMRARPGGGGGAAAGAEAEGAAGARRRRGGKRRRDDGAGGERGVEGDRGTRAHAGGDRRGVESAAMLPGLDDDALLNALFADER